MIHKSSWYAAALLAAAAGQGALAQENAADPYADDKSILRVCAASEEAPYSVKDRSGFENKIAEVLAKAMERKVLFKWYNKPAIYLVRDQLDLKFCDLVAGLDAGDERVLTSTPYYRAPYVFIQQKDSPLDIRDWDSPDLAKANNIGFDPNSPAQTMLEKVGLFNTNFNYMHSLTDFQDRRNKYARIPPERMVNEVANGTASLAVGFAPEVARYVKAAGNLTMIVIPDNNVRGDGEKVPHHFNQSFGVRKDDKELLKAIEAALPKAQPEIQGILTAEGVPMLPITQAALSSKTETGTAR